RDNAILAVTIVAGFASSIFFPATGFLLEHYGWRTTVILLATIFAAVTIPAHMIAVPGRREHLQFKHVAPAGSTVREALRTKGFWLIATAFILNGAALSAVSVLLVTYLVQAGHAPPVAATLAGLLGILSV